MQANIHSFVDTNDHMLNSPNVQEVGGAGGEHDSTATIRPKLVFFWNNAEVMKWLQRHGNEYYLKYGNTFLEHEITGRSLVRLRDQTLKTMGIESEEDREGLMRIILKLKLKSDIIEIKDLQKKATPTH